MSTYVKAFGLFMMNIPFYLLCLLMFCMMIDCVIYCLPVFMWYAPYLGAVAMLVLGIEILRRGLRK